MTFNLEKLKRIEKELREEVSNNKELSGKQDRRFYNVCNAINCIKIIIKEIENG